MNDSEKLASLPDRVLTLEIYFKIALGVVTLLFLGAGLGAYLLSDINSKITDASTRVNGLTSEITVKVQEGKTELESFRRLQETVIDQHVRNRLTGLTTLRVVADGDILVFPEGTSKDNWNVLIVPTSIGAIEGDANDLTGFAQINSDNSLLQFTSGVTYEQNVAKVRIKYWFRSTGNRFDSKHPTWSTTEYSGSGLCLMVPK